MSTIKFNLHLISDGEIGSGLGNEVVNDILARDHQGRPVLRGSHIKGLLRAQIEAIRSIRDWPVLLDVQCFGRGGENGDDGVLASIRVSDAGSKGKVKVRSITRTSLTELGVVHGATLRTSEAVAAGTVFSGEVCIADGAPLAVELAVRLALLSLEAVGGGRSRGGGACRVEIAGETRGPGDLLKALDIEIGKGLKPGERLAAAPVAPKEPDAPPLLLQLIFRANDPLCCPEIPVVGNNVIRAGLGVPASAVLGAIVSRLAQADASMAGAVFEDPRTRAWPLLPCAPDGEGAPLPVPVRVDLSHRMSKLSDDQGQYEFRDAAIEPYDWRAAAAGSPLKGADGVLLRADGENVTLWRSGDMPRIVTAHAVHHDPTGNGLRNLFTVESLAPMVYSGWISLPPRAAERLVELLRADPRMVFGKARTVRGEGRFEIGPADLSQAVAGWQNTVFVLQSPAAIPDDWDICSERAETVLDRLVRESGWGELAEAPREEGKIRVVTQASCGVRFGWNRHGVGNGVAQTRRLRARRVFLPGTVFVLKQPPPNLPALLVRGLGVDCGGAADGRMQGFGAVLPHPGIAIRRFQPESKKESFASDGAGKWAVEWFRKAGANGPSPSQIGAVAERITQEEGGKVALDYLDTQKKRPGRVWDRWSPVLDDVRTAIEGKHMKAKKALRTWQDLAIIHRKDKES